MFSAGMLTDLASAMIVLSRGFESGSPPPARAATAISLMIRVKMRPRLASAAPFLCLIVCHLEWPDIRKLQIKTGGKAQGLSRERLKVNKLAECGMIACPGRRDAPLAPIKRSGGVILPPIPLILALGSTAFAALLLEQVWAGRRREGDLRLRLQETAIELEQANARLEEMATRDDLTGVRNRRYFLEQLDLEWRRALRTREPVSLVVADIDAFKALNDRYGHSEGDSSLARVAACMRAAARRPSDCVARIGGEEFAILLPGTGAEGAVTFAERVRRDVEALRIPNAGSRVCPTLTISVGVSTTRPKPPDLSPALVAAADRGVSRSKTSGCNRVTLEEWPASTLLRQESARRPPVDPKPAPDNRPAGPSRGTPPSPRVPPSPPAATSGT